MNWIASGTHLGQADARAEHVLHNDMLRQRPKRVVAAISCSLRTLLHLTLNTLPQVREEFRLVSTS